MIKAGSSVIHTPTGEHWHIIGVNREKNLVCVAGYPPTVANLSDCMEIIEGQGIKKAVLEYRIDEFGTDWD